MSKLNQGERFIAYCWLCKPGNKSYGHGFTRGGRNDLGVLAKARRHFRLYHSDMRIERLSPEALRRLEKDDARTATLQAWRIDGYASEPRGVLFRPSTLAGTREPSE